jgi:hypothetical protein
MDPFAPAWDVISARCVSCHATRRPNMTFNEASYDAKQPGRLGSGQRAVAALAYGQVPPFAPLDLEM